MSITKRLDIDTVGDHATFVVHSDTARDTGADRGFVIDGPTPPRHFVERKEFHSRLSSRYQNRSGPTVVIGASGTGKTSAVSKFYRLQRHTDRPVGVWLDARTCTKPPENLRELQSNPASIVVLDNLNSIEHPAIRDGWLESACDSLGALIVLTTSEKVSERLQALFECPTAHDNLLSLDVFSECEVNRFYQKICRSVHSDLSRDAIKIAGSEPLALQLMADVIQSGCEDDFISFCQSSGTDQTMNLLLSCWIENCLRDELAELALAYLSRIPFAGIGFHSLPAILESEVEALAHPLQRLLDLGLVNICFGSDSQDARMLVAHESVRALPLWDESPYREEILIGKRRYISILGEALQYPEDKIDVLTCIDAWISGWTWVFQDQEFNDYDNDAFVSGIREYNSMLPSLAQRSAEWEHMSKEMYSLMNPYISSEMDCAPIIGIAHILRDLPPSHAVADMMWRATDNYDSWARASALGVSISHWERLGLSAIRRGQRQIQSWLLDAMDRRESESCGGSNEPNLKSYDVMVAVAGLQRLDGNEAMLSAVLAPRFVHNFGKSELVFAFALSCLRQASYFSNGDKISPEARRLMDLFFGSLAKTGTRMIDFWISEASTGSAPVEHSVAPQIINELTRIRGQIDCKPSDPTFALDVANYSRDWRFKKYVLRCEDRPRIHF